MREETPLKVIIGIIGQKKRKINFFIRTVDKIVEESNILFWTRWNESKQSPKFDSIKDFWEGGRMKSCFRKKVYWEIVYICVRVIDTISRCKFFIFLEGQGRGEISHN